jgi:hypothetical protein
MVIILLFPTSLCFTGVMCATENFCSLKKMISDANKKKKLHIKNTVLILTYIYVDFYLIKTYL